MALGTAGALGLHYISHAASQQWDTSGMITPLQEINQAAHWKKSSLDIADMQNNFVRAWAPVEVTTACEIIKNNRALKTFKTPHFS